MWVSPSPSSDETWIAKFKSKPKPPWWYCKYKVIQVLGHKLGACGPILSPAWILLRFQNPSTSQSPYCNFMLPKRSGLGLSLGHDISAMQVCVTLWKSRDVNRWILVPSIVKWEPWGRGIGIKTVSKPISLFHNHKWDWLGPGVNREYNMNNKNLVFRRDTRRLR